MGAWAYLRMNGSSERWVSVNTMTPQSLPCTGPTWGIKSPRPSCLTHWELCRERDALAQLLEIPRSTHRLRSAADCRANQCSRCSPHAHLINEILSHGGVPLPNSLVMSEKLVNAMNIVRRMPVDQTDETVQRLAVIQPELEEELREKVDVPLEVREDPEAGKSYLCCD